MQPMISFKNVNKYYKDFHALKNINLSVYEGEILCIIGPSGSGKSTLIRCIFSLIFKFVGPDINVVSNPRLYKEFAIS